MTLDRTTPNEDEQMTTTYPIHHLDGENRGVCPHSGSLRETDSTPCPRGCDGARHHYANDGHADCEA